MLARTAVACTTRAAVQGRHVRPSEKFIEAHSGRVGDISIYGQESNYTTWRLAKMNLAIRGIDAQIAHGDAFHNDRHPELLKADHVLANPPFNDSDWRGELLRGDKRWVYGDPPAGNANFAWVQHFVHHLAPTGIAGFVLANGSMSSSQSGEGGVRANTSRTTPSSIVWSRCPASCSTRHKFRSASGYSLGASTTARSGIDAATPCSSTPESWVRWSRFRVHRELAEGDVMRIAGTYHAWRGDSEAGEYSDILGFCKSATLEDIRGHGHVLTPGRYVGAEAADDDEPFGEKMNQAHRDPNSAAGRSSPTRCGDQREPAGPRLR